MTQYDVLYYAYTQNDIHVLYHRTQRRRKKIFTSRRATCFLLEADTSACLPPLTFLHSFVFPFQLLLCDVCGLTMMMLPIY